jgi:ribonuclease VapC
LIVDSSAMVAMLKEEPESGLFMEILTNADRLEMSAATYLETGIVADRSKNSLLSGRVDQVIEAFGIVIVPVTESQAKLARAAYRKFGKHSGHPAQLNFGDCFAYALAMERGVQLLFKGDDFAQTDVVSAR